MRLAAFTDSGYFWLPGDENRSRQVAGTLAVSEAGCVTLETFGYRSNDPLSLAHDLLIPIQNDYGVIVTAGRLVRVSRIQPWPHSCRTRAGSACQALRIGSSASFWASRVGYTRSPRARRSSWQKRSPGFSSGA